MYKLEQKLTPTEFKETFARVNKEDHQRPPHPWDLLFREGKCTRQQLQGWAKERCYFVKQVPIKEYAKYCDTRELQQDCINAQLLKNNIRRVMSDAIYMAYVVQGMTCGNGDG